MNEPLLEYRNVSHIFPDGTAGIRNVDFSVRMGDFIVIAGQNGSGKTVLMKHANGLLKPTAGEIFFKGNPLQRDILTVRQRIGLVFQNPDNQIICPTVREEIAFGPENLGKNREWIDEQVNRIMKVFHLDPVSEKQTAVLSGGEKRKLTIAGILAMEPEVLILDEPFIGLDYPGIREVLGRIVQLHREGCTILVITHELEKILAHADRMVIMDGGRIAADGSPEALLGNLEQYGIRNPLRGASKREELSWLM